jgi:hypothetical protein
MALDDKILNKIFKNQKKSEIDALRSLGLTETRRQVIRLEFEEEAKEAPTSNPTDIKEQETGYKPGTNRVQSGFKSGDKPGTNWVQTGYKEDQKTDKVGTNRVQSGFKSGDITGYKVGTNWVQTEYKLSTKIPFTELAGLQREIVVFLCLECKKNRAKSTEPITLDYLVNSLKRSRDAIKTSIKRLEKKGCITRTKFKNGRGGWSQYEIPADIYQDAIRYENGYKWGTNWVQTGYKVGSELGSELGTTRPSSSSNNNNIIIETTTTADFLEKWNFDISAYSKFGFGIIQIKQLASLNTISPSEVEQSLIEFNYDYENNALPLIKTNKINFLMGLLRGGHSYISENYRTTQDQMVKLMAERANKKRQAQIEEKFVAWEGGLSDEERREIESKLPTYLIVRHRASGITDAEVRNWLFNYYLILPKE